MPEPFKNQLHADLIVLLASRLQEAWPAFPAARFVEQATTGLEELELKQRVVHIRQALDTTLPADFDHAADIIEAALGPEPDTSTPWALENAARGLSGWAIWPLTDYVAHHGLAHFERSMGALHALTRRFTAEFAIRPFLVRHREACLAQLEAWTRDSSEHVRRLVSEGSRPRLPWGLRLQAFVDDPTPCLPLLQALKNDGSEYVRRSVANHLNDIAKDHPELAVRIADEWLRDGQMTTQRLVRHALRSLVKQGHRGALALLGYEEAEHVRLERLELDGSTVAEGGKLGFHLQLRNTGALPERLCIDYAVHHRKANGSLSPKVFKLSTAELESGAVLELRKSHSFRPVTTRRYHPGEHGIEILVNGRSLGYARFELLPAPTAHP